MRSIMLAAGAVTALALSIGGPLTAHAREATAPRAQGWLVSAYGQVEVPPPAPDVKAELTELKRIMAKRTPEDIARFQWWATGGPVYRWNEIAVEEMLDGFITVPMVNRHLALIHAAMDDAVAVAWHHRASSKRPRPFAADPSIKAQAPAPPVRPSPPITRLRRRPRQPCSATSSRRARASSRPRPRRPFSPGCWRAWSTRATSRPDAPSASASPRSPSRAASPTAPMPSGPARCRRDPASGRARTRSRRWPPPGSPGCSRASTSCARPRLLLSTPSRRKPRSPSSRPSRARPRPTTARCIGRCSAEPACTGCGTRLRA